MVDAARGRSPESCRPASSGCADRGSCWPFDARRGVGAGNCVQQAGGDAVRVRLDARSREIPASRPGTRRGGRSRCASPSYEPKKNCRFCTTGPPRLRAELVELQRRLLGREVVPRVERRVAVEFPDAGRETALVPDLVCMLMTAPLPRPNSDAKFGVWTWTSSTDSRLGTIAGSPRVVRVGVHRAVEDVVVAAIAVAVDGDDRRARQLGRVGGAGNQRRARAQLR